MDGEIWQYSSEEKPVIVVGLVKPRPFFVEDAQYFLVFGTPLEMLILKVCCSKNGEHLHPLVNYNTSLDGVTVTCI